jgi:hypothetical protein
MTDLSEQAVDLDEVVGGEPAGDGLDAVDEQLIARLAGRAREGGLALTGEGGLLAQLTKRLVESALEGELTDHLGYDRETSLPRQHCRAAWWRWWLRSLCSVHVYAPRAGTRAAVIPRRRALTAAR